uniref:Uncharacterized protein n=1 Tax=Human betaherpesvirus 6 TaxID=10368 RepID=A0A5P9U568_9BETA|nr:hypothetical protein [Human betaherpesvirus 6]
MVIRWGRCHLQTIPCMLMLNRLSNSLNLNPL